MSKYVLLGSVAVVAVLVLHLCAPIALAEGQIQNPLGANTTFTGVIINVINFMLSLVGVLSLLGVIYGGIRMVVAVGNENSISEAKKIIFWSIAGLTVSILSWTIVNIFLKDVLGAITQATIPLAYAEEVVPLNLQEQLSKVQSATNLPNTITTDSLAKKIAKFITGITATVALLAFIYGAFLVVVSLGDDQKVSQGKKIMFYALMGLLLIGFAYTIISIVGGIITP